MKSEDIRWTLLGLALIVATAIFSGYVASGIENVKMAEAGFEQRPAPGGRGWYWQKSEGPITTAEPAR